MPSPSPARGPPSSGLLWSEVDFARNVIHIRRIQERDGSLTEMTKTEAGTRDIPIERRAARDVTRMACPPLPA